MKSKWWRRASDLARARNVMLWWRAYKEMPAGSLPDDDDELAEAAGFGFDVQAFEEHKAEIMAPWVLCSDGRWYHRVVCEIVNEALERQSAKRKAQNERKARSRAKLGPVTSEEAFVTRDGRHQHEDVTRDIGEITRENSIHNRQDTTEYSGSDEPDAARVGKQQAFLIDEEEEGIDTEDVEPDLDKRAWKEAVRVLTGQGRMREGQARAFFGKLLSQTGLIARELIPALASAEVRQTPDPQAYLVNAAKGTAERRGLGRYGQRSSSEDRLADRNSRIASMLEGAEAALARRG